MAEAVVSNVLPKLGKLVAEEAIFLFGVREKFEWLERELKWVKSFLRDADTKRKKDERVKNWVDEVIDVSYQAEDATDSFLILLKQPPIFPCFPDCIPSFAPHQLMERHRIGVEIDKIKTRIDEINRSRESYGIQSLGEDGESVKIPVRRASASPHQFEDMGDIVGRHDTLDSISKQLLDPHKQQLCFTCIYGTGGLGKTTLARKIFQNKDIRQHFPLRIWLTVTQYSSSGEALKEILKRVKGDKSIESGGIMDVESLIEMWRELPSEEVHRCLVVLDDVWEDNKGICSLVQRCFRSMMNGSRVLVTTRSSVIAKQVDTSTEPHQLGLLTDDESVELLLKKAFPHQDVETSCPKDLVDLAPRLAKRCGRLPLALAVLGGILSVRETTPYVWKKMEEKMNWGSHGKECQEVLALSYEVLDYDKKPCFLYLGMFPQDYEISASLLVKLWVAEGLVKDEDAGYEVLEELVQRSLVQIKKQRIDGRIKKVSVHDLLLELAKDETKENGFLAVHTSGNHNGSSSSSTHARRIAVHNLCFTANQIENQSMLPGLKTLIQFSSFFNQGPGLLFRSELMRVIELQGGALPQRLPKVITNMKHLRYLGLRGTGVEELPESIAQLQLLETIDLRGCYSPTIPSTLFRIKTLRHVQTDGALRPPSKLVLLDLRSLGKVAVGSNYILDWKFPKLEKISLTEVVTFHGAVLAHVLAQLDHLVVLKIQGTCIPTEIDLMAFAFHQNLGSLELKGKWPRGDAFVFPSYLTKVYLGESLLEQDPMPKLERLQYLNSVRLSFKAYTGTTMVCSAGGFPQLEHLSITYLTSLKEWKVEQGAMPKLTYLKISDCNQLDMLPELQHVSNLQTLSVSFMPKEFCSKLDKDNGEDWYKIKHVPTIVIGCIDLSASSFPDMIEFFMYAYD